MKTGGVLGEGFSMDQLDQTEVGEGCDFEVTVETNDDAEDKRNRVVGFVSIKNGTESGVEPGPLCKSGARRNFAGISGRTRFGGSSV